MKDSLLVVGLFFVYGALCAQGVIPPSGGTAIGTTIGAGNDCGLRSSQDYYYSFTPVSNGVCGSVLYTVSLCNNTFWDTYLYIFDGSDCSTASVVASNDDHCSLQSQITYSFTEGNTYYIYIEGYSGEGNYQLDVFPAASIPVLSGDYYLIGDAAAGEGNCYVLTGATNGQISCIWSSFTIDFSQSFSLEYTINLGNDDSGADGMAFVMQNSPENVCACGTGGGSLAYGGMGAVTNSLIFEIDTYVNTEDRDDFSFPCVYGFCSDPDHSAIHVNGNWQDPVSLAQPLMNGAAEYNIENGNDHKLLVDWDGSVITFTIMDDSQITTYVSMSYNFDPMALFGTETPYFGFTGSTGFVYNEQGLCVQERCSVAPKGFVR